MILFVRNQKDWILSDYIQDVKGGGIYSLEKYLQISLENESEKYDLYKLISNLKNSEVNLTIRPYLRNIRKNWKLSNAFPGLSLRVRIEEKNRRDQRN